MRFTIAKTGFTLIELLVVISILALLAAMLLPAITGARRSAQMTADNNNVKQLYTTVASYRSDHGGTWPMGDGITLDSSTRVPSPADYSCTRLVWFHLATIMEMAPKSFISPANPSPKMIVGSPALGDSVTTWDPDDSGTDYALDYSTPVAAGSARPVITSRDPDMFGTGKTNICFNDGHTENADVEDPDNYNFTTASRIPAAGQVLNPTDESDDLFVSESGDDNTPFGRGERKRAFCR